jgi:NAD(P)-dependent dehydrogenase (short-subunit alcohol dehydrogenase family)
VQQVIVITGASSGFGELTAHTLGHIVYASMRETNGRNAPQVEAAKRFAAVNKVDLRTIELDVSSQESLDAAIQQIVSENGRLDVVIHNAGHMVFGPAEAFTPEQLAVLQGLSQFKPKNGSLALFAVALDLLFEEAYTFRYPALQTCCQQEVSRTRLRDQD